MSRFGTRMAGAACHQTTHAVRDDGQLVHRYRPRFHQGFELIGEWNDTLHNDIAILKRMVLEPMMDAGIDVVSSDYATIAAEQTALENLATDVANRILTSVALELRGSGAGEP